MMTIRRSIALAASVVLAVGVTACGGDDDEGGATVAETTAQTTAANDAGGGAADGPVKIAFSAPAADHGWMAAITRNAREEAESLGDVDLQLAEGATDSAGQSDQVETLINGRPDVLVILPNEGDALTPVAQRATAAGIPVVNVDREFESENAYRTFIGGDNYGIGWQAGNFFADELRCEGNVVEIQGIAGISVTELRTQGFADALRQRCRGGIEIVAQQPADFLPDRGLSVMETILQANDDIDGVYTHDDDMAEGVVAAIENANRQDEMFLTGAGGSRAAMERIKEGGLYRATFLYNPSMSASAIRLARLIARGEGLEELAEPEVPSRIQMQATAVTRENVDDLMELGF